MRLQTSWDAGDSLRRLDALEQAVAKPNTILRRWTGYLRSTIKERFAAGGPGWPPLAESTQKDREHRYTGRITMAGNVRASYATKRASAVKGQILKALRRGEGPGRKGKSLGETLARYHASTEKLSAAAARQKKRIREARDLVAAERALPDQTHDDILAVAAAAGRKKRKGEQLTVQEQHALTYKKLQGKKGPSSGKTVAEKGRQILGRIASMIAGKLFARGVEVGLVNEEAARKFSIHNTGGTAGHGAKIPERAFAYLDSNDPDILADIAQDEMTKATRG